MPENSAEAALGTRARRGVFDFLFICWIRKRCAISDDMNFEHFLSKYAMTFIDTEKFVCDVESSEKSTEDSKVSKEREDDKHKDGEKGEQEAKEQSSDWKCLEKRGWVRILRTDYKRTRKAFIYTHPNVTAFPITSMKKAIFIDKQRGVGKTKKKKVI